VEENQHLPLWRESKSIYERINKQLRKAYSRVFIFMKAYPLVEKAESHKFRLVQAGRLTKLASSFRKKIFNNISRKKKKITLKFEILTYNNLLEVRSYI
jgi:hypothetical protein